MKITTCSEEETFRLGQAIGGLLKSGDVVSLVGDLGTGKTRLAQGMGAALGVQDGMVSPTFAFINEYSGDTVDVMHADLYRIERTDELIDIGLDEYLTSDWVCIIEWADRALEYLPSNRLDIFLEKVSDSERLINIYPRGARFGNVCEVLSRDASPRN